MTDIQLLFLVLALIYGWECACWLKLGSVAFRSWFGRRWALAHPARLLGNQHGGFVFGHPLPPLGTLLVSHDFPFSLAPDGVVAGVAYAINPNPSTNQITKLVPWEELRGLEVKGRKLRFQRSLLHRAASPTYAQYLAEQLSELQKLPSNHRNRAIEKVAEAAFDSDQLKDRWQQFQNATGLLRLLTNALFLLLFLVAPLLIRQFGFRQCWLWLLIGVLALTLTTALVFGRLHKQFYETAEDERFTHFITVLLSPATTIRARDILSRPLLENFHPLALAKEFCSDEVFQRFSRQFVRELRFPRKSPVSEVDSSAETAERYWRELLQKTVEKFLRGHGVDPKTFTQPPTPLDQTCRSYCPRCEAQFTTPEGLCAECGGLPLIAYADRSNTNDPKSGS